METHVRLIRKHTSLLFKDYCRIYFNEDIRTFRQRLRAGMIEIKHLHLMEKHTGKKFSDLFPESEFLKVSPKKKVRTDPNQSIYFDFN